MTIFRFDHPTRLTKGYNHESYGQLNLTHRDAMKRNEYEQFYTLWAIYEIHTARARP